MIDPVKRILGDGKSKQYSEIFIPPNRIRHKFTQEELEEMKEDRFAKPISSYIKQFKRRDK